MDFHLKHLTSDESNFAIEPTHDQYVVLERSIARSEITRTRESVFTQSCSKTEEVQSR